MHILVKLQAFYTTTILLIVKIHLNGMLSGQIKLASVYTSSFPDFNTAIDEFCGSRITEFGCVVCAIKFVGAEVLSFGVASHSILCHTSAVLFRNTGIAAQTIA